MKEKLIKLGVQGMVTLGAFSPLLALAENSLPPQSLPNSGITSPSAVGNILCSIAGWMFYFLVILAIIFVLYAAFTYLTAGGDAEKVSSANQMLIYAVVAIIVGILAKGVPTIVGGILSTGVNTACQ